MKHLVRENPTHKLTKETNHAVRLLEEVGFEEVKAAGILDRELCRYGSGQVVSIRRVSGRISSIRLLVNHRAVGQAVAFDGESATAETALLRLFVTACDDRPSELLKANEGAERGQS